MAEAALMSGLEFLSVSASWFKAAGERPENGMHPKIATIGYEGSTLQALLGALEAADVQTLVDVRAVPLSRKPGFSKQALRAGVESVGLDYLHLRDLGNPKEGREAAKVGGMPAFASIYEAHLVSTPAQTALGELAALAQERRVCLLCFEADPLTCHRLLVARALVAKAGGTIEHLHPQASRFGSGHGHHRKQLSSALR
ncbi:DUF488 family protein [Aureimonas phyllosphaerae]|uniref:DUF488 domain-containing protein n=1 Tax=Aureimonas phyllosphaerae TaxID=1166078 RepID=UPI003A5BBD2F